jgi:hypothetical protein
MSASNRYVVPLFAATFGACLLATGCDEKKPPPEAAGGPDAGTKLDKYATADSKLTKALQAAEKAAPGTDDGPPPEGVFAPGVADRRHPASTPAKVELVTDGDEPRVMLATTADASADSSLSRVYGPAVLEVAVQLGPRTALPTIDMSLLLGAAKGDPSGPDWIAATIKKALPSPDQAADIGPEGAKEVASLEGTQLLVKVTDDGRASDLRTILGKGARQELDRVAKNAAEALLFATAPAPPKAVGVGAQWFAETRMAWAGIDVIAYRAFKVKSIDGNRVDVSVDVKGYATSSDIDLPGVPPGSVLKQFDARAQGDMEVVGGEALARKVEIQERVLFVFTSTKPPEGAPDQPPPGPEGTTLTGQVQAAAMFVRGDDLREAARGKAPRK